MRPGSSSRAKAGDAQKRREAVKAAGEKRSELVAADLSTKLMEAPLTIDEHLAHLPRRDDMDLRIMLQRMCSLEHLRDDVGKIPKVEITI
jgi:hypothetical protein